MSNKYSFLNCIAEQKDYFVYQKNKKIARLNIVTFKDLQRLVQSGSESDNIIPEFQRKLNLHRSTISVDVQYINEQCKEELRSFMEDKLPREIKQTYDDIIRHRGLGYHSHNHFHQERSTPSLKSIVSFAFMLGFVHEEEFVILAIAASQSVNPILLIVAYAISVSAALIGITVISLRFYLQFQYRIIQYSKYLPMTAALFLIFISIGIVIGII